MAIRYAIADDHGIFRQGLRSALAGDMSVECAGEAANGQELIQLLSKTQVDVALVDLKMPVMDGFEVTAEIVKSHEQTRVIILTMFDDEPFIVRLMEGGANGYLLKNAHASEIITAIHSAYETGYYFSELVSTALLKEVAKQEKRKADERPLVKLNDKEIEIIRLICQEYTTAEIGERVFLSARTVEGIRASIMDKIGVRNVAGLVIYAVRNGYFS